MSDDSFIREVNEELRQDQAKDLWERYGKWLIAAAVAIVLATAANRGWDYYSTSVAAESGDKFMQAVDLSNQGKGDEAIKILENLASEGSGQYPALAKLRIASELAAGGDNDLAIESYDEIANDTSFNESFRTIAQLRAGLLAVDVNDLEDVTKRLAPLSDPGLPYRHSAREGLGLASYKAGKLSAALKWFDAIANDSDAGAAIRNRANVMLDLLAGKGITQEKASG
ncbi:MAG: tetratricopeptide repeat protein [Rhizobiaceae bacterium]|nr:tetratricopeptide repeat protein [Rhizobiaceae bacterium]